MFSTITFNIKHCVIDIKSTFSSIFSFMNFNEIVKQDDSDTAKYNYATKCKKWQYSGSNM